MKPSAPSSSWGSRLVERRRRSGAMRVVDLPATAPPDVQAAGAQRDLQPRRAVQGTRRRSVLQQLQRREGDRVPDRLSPKKVRGDAVAGCRRGAP